MKPLARIARLSAAFLCSNAARGGIGLATALVLGRWLGPARFGGWVLCTAWASSLTAVVDLGFGVLLTRDGARDDGDPGRLLGGALVLRLAAALPLAAALAAAPALLSSDPETISALRVAAVLGAAGAAYGCFGSLLRSQPRWLPTILAVETAWLAIQGIGAWTLLANGRGVAALVALAAVLQIAQIATALALWPFVFSARPLFARPGPLMPVLRRALPFAASGLVANLQARIGPLMLGMLATPTDVGWFGAASRVGRGVRLAPQAVLSGALPVLAHEYGRDTESARAASASLDRLVIGASAAGAALCAVAAPLVMPLVFGRSFAGAVPTLVWVAVGLAPSLINSTRKVVLYATGREAVVVRWSAVALAVQALVATVLIPLAGSAGAAIAAALGEAAVFHAFAAALRAEVRSLKSEVRSTGSLVMGEVAGAAGVDISS